MLIDDYEEASDQSKIDQSTSPRESTVIPAVVKKGAQDG